MVLVRRDLTRPVITGKVYQKFYTQSAPVNLVHSLLLSQASVQLAKILEVCACALPGHAPSMSSLGYCVITWDGHPRTYHCVAQSHSPSLPREKWHLSRVRKICF